MNIYSCTYDLVIFFFLYLLLFFFLFDFQAEHVDPKVLITPMYFFFLSLGFAAPPNRNLKHLKRLWYQSAEKIDYAIIFCKTGRRFATRNPSQAFSLAGWRGRWRARYRKTTIIFETPQDIVWRWCIFWKGGKSGLMEKTCATQQVRRVMEGK